MSTYIALLRGINVSGQKKIKMTDLIAHLKDLKFKNVQTYIQSGNVIFETSIKDKKNISGLIEKKIKKEYGFEVSVIIKSPKDFKDVLAKNPFTSKDTEKIYFTFLSEKPSPENINKLKTYDYSPEEYILDGENIYFFAPKGYGNAKMNNNFFENKLKVSATTRNWKTVNKLIEMAS